MSDLSNTGRLSMIHLLRQILQHNPSIKVLSMSRFSRDRDVDENIGEIVLETLLSSGINSITDLDLRVNRSWFRHPET